MPTTVKLPIPLVVRRDGVDPEDKVVAYACGACGIVHQTSAAAEQCCAPYHCAKCGVETERYHLMCKTCDDVRVAAVEQARFDKAQKLRPEDYTGPIFCDEQSHGDMGDCCWSDLAALIEHVEEEQSWFDDEATKETKDKDPSAPTVRPELPPYVYACEEIPFRLHADQIIEAELEDHYEDAGDQISEKDVVELRTLLDAWCEKQGISSWQQDTGRVIILDEKS